MSGAVGSSMVGLFFFRSSKEKKFSVRKYLDIYLICKQDTKDKMMTEVIADVGRNERLAESILCHLRAVHGG